MLPDPKEEHLCAANQGDVLLDDVDRSLMMTGFETTRCCQGSATTRFEVGLKPYAGVTDPKGK